MTLVRYSDLDWRPARFSSFLDRFFDESMGSARLNRFRPSVDILENDKSFEVRFAVPGMKKEDFNVDINDGVMTVSGERKMEKVTDNESFHTVETQYGSFSRSFNLPDHVLSDKVDAKYVDGILHVVLPKDEKKLLKTSVKVK